MDIYRDAQANGVTPDLPAELSQLAENLLESELDDGTAELPLSLTTGAGPSTASAPTAATRTSEAAASFPARAPPGRPSLPPELRALLHLDSDQDEDEEVVEEEEDEQEDAEKDVEEVRNLGLAQEEEEESSDEAPAAAAPVKTPVGKPARAEAGGSASKEVDPYQQCALINSFNRLLFTTFPLFF